MTAAYVATAQRRLAGLSQRSRHRAATVDATVVQAALTAGDWLPERCLRTVTDVAVYTVRGPRGETGVLKVSATGGRPTPPCSPTGPGGHSSTGSEPGCRPLNEPADWYSSWMTHPDRAHRWLRRHGR
jgi:hypothetical protein